MQVLIFGGSGFIGTHLVNHLWHENGIEIYNLDIIENDHGGKSKFIFCDVRQPVSIDIKHLSNPVIINLAAVHRTPGHPDRDYFDANIRGAENICRFATAIGCRKILFTSSIAPYGAGEDEKHEETLPMPNTPYGISKLVAEKIHEGWQKQGDENALVILRPGVVFGTGENGNFTRLYSALDKGTFFYPGRKDTIKAAIYVKDLVAFAWQIITTIEKGKGDLYNCTYEPPCTIEQIVKEMCLVTGKKVPGLVVNARLLLILARVIGSLGGNRLGVHPDRVKKLMVSTNICGKKMASSGYQLKYPLKTAIADWFKDNGNLKLA